MLANRLSQTEISAVKILWKASILLLNVEVCFTHVPQGYIAVKTTTLHELHKLVRKAINKIEE